MCQICTACRQAGVLASCLSRVLCSNLCGLRSWECFEHWSVWLFVFLAHPLWPRGWRDRLFTTPKLRGFFVNLDGHLGGGGIVPQALLPTMSRISWPTRAASKSRKRLRQRSTLTLLSVSKVANELVKGFPKIIDGSAQPDCSSGSDPGSGRGVFWPCAASGTGYLAPQEVVLAPAALEECILIFMRVSLNEP